MPQKLRCRVMDILDHGERVYSVILKPEKTAPRFQPGQFLHLALDEYNPGDFWPDSRSFSIASAPAERQLLRITYAVKGQFTGRMEAELHPERDVWIKMPYGEFIISAEKDVCLLAGGTGVTAFTAFLSKLGVGHAYPVTLFYGARRSDLLIYRSQVESAAAICSKLRPVFMVEQDRAPGCLTGQIDLELVWKMLPNPASVTYYISGPPNMLKALSTELVQRGIFAEKICADAWE